MVLYVVRHGESQTNIQGRYGGQYDTPLTPKGLEQAKQLAERLNDTDFDVIISSSLIRAKQTAAVIKEAFDRPLFYSDGFMERNMGVYEGLTQEEIIEKHPDLWNRRCTRKLDDAPTNGETYRQFTDRVTNALINLKEDYDKNNVLLVTHTFVAKVINRYCNNLSFDEMHDFSLPNCDFVKFIL